MLAEVGTKATAGGRLREEHKSSRTATQRRPPSIIPQSLATKIACKASETDFGMVQWSLLIPYPGWC